MPLSTAVPIIQYKTHPFLYLGSSADSGVGNVWFESFSFLLPFLKPSFFLTICCFVSSTREILATH